MVNDNTFYTFPITAPRSFHSLSAQCTLDIVWRVFDDGEAYPLALSSHVDSHPADCGRYQHITGGKPCGDSGAASRNGRTTRVSAGDSRANSDQYFGARLG